MSLASKRARAEAQLHTFEEEFTSHFISALRDCAAGRWGMFGRNDAVIETEPKRLREKLRSRIAERLIEDGESINRLRQELGHAEGFRLFERYLEYRQMHSANLPGEPKLALQFLKELGLE